MLEKDGITWRSRMWEEDNGDGLTTRRERPCERKRERVKNNVF